MGYDRELWQTTVNAMQRVEEIKNKRAKDIREVEHDLALIKSPAAGLKKANDALVEMAGEENSELDTSLGLKTKQRMKIREEAKLEEIHESDQEMEAAEV